MKWQKCNTALPGDLVTVDRATRRVQSLIAALLGAALTGLLFYTYAEAEDILYNDPHPVIKGCRLPEVNGAMTVFVMENGKFKCWRWR